jgi:hypothetical protein
MQAHGLVRADQWRWLSLHKLIDRNREVSNAFARGVEDCIANRSSRTRNPYLSDAAGSQWIELRVGYIQHGDVEFADVRGAGT